jgi:hypothetical protein
MLLISRALIATDDSLTLAAKAEARWWTGWWTNDHRTREPAAAAGARGVSDGAGGASQLPAAPTDADQAVRPEGRPAARFRLRGVARVRHPEGRIRARWQMRQLTKVGRFPEV